MNWRQKRDGTNVRYLLKVASEYGLAPAECLENTGLPEGDLENCTTLELWQELAVIRNVVAHHPHPGTGLRLGLCYHLTSLGLLGYAMLSSRTLGEAIKVCDQFRPLSLSICPVILEKETSGLLMHLDDSVLPPDARCLVVERGLAAWTNLFGELLQRRYLPLRIDLKVPEATDEELYRNHFGCPVVLGASSNSMLISWNDLNSALPLANTTTQQTCANLCQRLCESLDDVRTPLARQVLQMLMGQSGQHSGARQIAGWLNLSERTLHRRLAEEGFPFRSLDERVRRDLAEQLLGNSALGLESIALQLGYAEAASFSRAFKRWTGLSPKLWRHQRAFREVDPLVDALTAVRQKVVEHA
ncbi:hypothetical protein LCGC14_0201930 [marine sediment metagenome]